MANLTVYSVKKLEQTDYKIFAGLYNDFKNRAITDFKFDLEPLEYEDFAKAVENKLLQCLVLMENSIPTGFLIYTTLISYSIELNLIYLISNESYDAKVRALINEFFNLEAELITKKVVTYPLLGEQETYRDVLYEFGFKDVRQSVLKFDFTNPACISKINKTKDLEISWEYRIVNWDDIYFNNAVKIIYNNFKEMSDALFDPRFNSYAGVEDIISKIVNSNYGEFLPQYTKLAIKDGILAGICFVNVTGSTLVNIPLVAVDKPYRHQRLGEKLTSMAVTEVLEDTLNGKCSFTEVNVTTDTFNTGAMRMYKFCGFNEEYQYTQSYREPSIV